MRVLLIVGALGSGPPRTVPGVPLSPTRTDGPQWTRPGEHPPGSWYQQSPYFFQRAAGAGVITAISVGLYASKLLPPPLSPALVLAANLTVLLATSFTVYILASVAVLGVTGSCGLAAITVGFLGRLVSRRLRLPPLVMAVSGITPLLPGLTT